MLESTARASARRKPLAAACLATFFCVTAPAVSVAATNWTVDTCADANAGSGTNGSLRYAAANAVSGDTIDLASLACSAISLATGSVTLPQTDIAVKGPGKGALVISGDDDRVFRHTGHGTLKLYDLTVADGYYHPSLGVKATGGCIHSNGQVYLQNVGVHACRAAAVGAAARGGGVYAYDTFFANTATSPATSRPAPVRPIAATAEFSPTRTSSSPTARSAAIRLRRAPVAAFTRSATRRSSRPRFPVTARIAAVESTIASSATINRFR